jgi:hypothetical protein
MNGRNAKDLRLKATALAGHGEALAGAVYGMRGYESQPNIRIWCRFDRAARKRGIPVSVTLRSTGPRRLYRLLKKGRLSLRDAVKRGLGLTDAGADIVLAAEAERVASGRAG